MLRKRSLFCRLEILLKAHLTYYFTVFEIQRAIEPNNGKKSGAKFIQKQSRQEKEGDKNIYRNNTYKGRRIIQLEKGIKQLFYSTFTTYRST